MKKNEGTGSPGFAEILHDEIILEPYVYLCKVPGKDVRGKLISAFNTWLDVPEGTLLAIRDVVSMLHNSSLLIDDIEDDSDLRRGIPVAHSVYGVPAVINSANFVYFRALEAVARLGSNEATSECVRELLLLHHGQGYDIFWRDHAHCPTEAEYRAMVVNKTGGLFRLAVTMMHIFANRAERYPRGDLLRLVNLLGLYFQVRDDYFNLQDAELQNNKGFCEDITEGKFSFPIIHAIRANPSDHRLLNILSKKTKDVHLKQHAVKYMEEVGSFAYTRAFLADLQGQIAGEIEQLGGNPLLTEILAHLAKGTRLDTE